MPVSVNKDAIFTKSGIFNTGQTIITANTAKDGTGTVVTVFDPQRAITSITASGTTATITFTNVSGFLNGEDVLISGAGEAGYNGIKTLTITGPKTATYTVGSGISSPATGTIVADPINGQRINSVVFQPIGATTSASVGRVFLNNGQTNATPANNTYLDDITLPIQASTTENAAMPGNELTLDIVVPPFHKLNVTIGTTVTAGFAVYCIAGGY